jgi:hypothetical protein
MLKDLKTLGVLSLLFFVCAFAAALTYSGESGTAASYLFNSNSSKTTPTFTAPKVNSSSYSIPSSYKTPSSPSTFTKNSVKSTERIQAGQGNKAYGNTTPTPQPTKKK